MAEGSHTSPLPQAAHAIEDGIAQGLHLGAQLCVIHRGQVIVDAAFGQSRPGTPMTTDTLLPWMSAGKPLTVAAIAQIWEYGRLQLDDPVARHIPEFAAHGKDAITIRHLLTHTGGFRVVPNGWPTASWESVIASICAARPEPRWVPGHKAGYHPLTSWFILGELIRQIDGRPVEQYVRQEFFEPLGMPNCFLAMSPAQYESYGSRMGTIFDQTKSPAAPLEWDKPELASACSPGSTARGPARELARFYQMLLEHGQLGGTHVLLPQTIEAMTARHRVGLMDHTFKRKLDWGLGFILNSRHHGDDLMPYGYGRHASLRTFGHGGNQSSAGMADPEHQLVIIAIFNGMPGHAIHDQRVHRLIDAVYQELGLATDEHRWTQIREEEETGDRRQESE